MWRLCSCLLIAAAVLVGSSVVAGAQTLDQVVTAVEARGFYADPGADVDVDQLADLVSDELAVVVLAADDPDGADVAADQVLGELADETTVLVISPGEVGAVSDTFGDADLDDALDATLDAFDTGGSTSDAVAAFGSSLGLARRSPPQDGATATDPATGDGNGGGSGIGGFLVFLVVIAVLIGGFIWFARRKGKRVDADEVERARSEIRAQLEVVARQIVDLEAEVDVSGNGVAIGHFRSANATYTDVSSAVHETENLFELAELNDNIDRARWELEAAHALIDGRPVPPEPEPEKPAACFFDPTHRPGTHEATIRTNAGTKDVMVCGECAEKLERGEKPDPRMIDVGGRRVPAAKAPRSHGGLGMGGLSIFEVILGGLGALAAGRGASQPSRATSSSSDGGVPLDWGDMLPKRRRSTNNPFGQDRLPPRPVGVPRTPASRPTGSSRRSRRRGLPSSSSVGRARRGR